MEANVVIVLVNSTGASRGGIVIPYWECEMSDQELLVEAIKKAVAYSEKRGSGPTTFEIIDYRTVEAGV